MNVTITARHADITDAMRDRAQEKADWLANHFEFLRDIQITLNVESRRHTAEFIAITRKAEQLIASAATEDMYATLDKATDKLANQLHKFKDKIKQHRVPNPEKEET